jgi:two-component system sensor histidine kinase FlrB
MNRQMLPSSHPAPMIPHDAGTSAATLAEAFDAFIATAGRMELTYGQLQAEVAQLRAELKERNAALRVSLEENSNIRAALQQILEALPCGVIVMDRNHRIVLINPEAQRLIAAPANLKLRLEDFPLSLQAKLKSAIAREDEHDFFLENENRWLSIRKAELDLTNQNDDERSSERTILIVRDVTARKKAEEQRERSRDMVSLGEMAAVLAHEIRNPLSSLELWTGLLAKLPTGDPEAGYVVENLQAGVRSISATVNNVLQFHNTGVLNHAPLPLLAVLQNGAAFVRPLADQAGIRLTLQAPIGKTEILGDATALQQVILNLAINAFRHTARGGTFGIGAQLMQDEHRVSISFADTGEGIVAANLPSIFERKVTKTSGPGLGLLICRRIVEQHRGTIRVESQRGKGTTFFLEFPVL